MKSILIQPLIPQNDIYGGSDANNLSLLVSGFTGTTYLISGITDDIQFYTVKIVKADCNDIIKTFTFTVTATPTVTPTNTPTPTPSSILITWQPYEAYCVTDFGCPTNYVLTSDNLYCLAYETIAANPPSGTTYVVANRQHPDYSDYGALIYPFNGYDITGNITSGFVTTGNTNSPLWLNGGTSEGRLNTVGVWPITQCSGGTFIPVANQWIGFSQKIVLSESKIYYVGLAGDNRVRFKVNGQLIVEQQGTASENFKYWHIYPVQLYQGNNYIEIYGFDDGLVSASFGGEIYNNTLADLMASTAESDLNIVFSTKNMFCNILQLGDANGYSCPTGFAFDPTNTTCVRRDEIAPMERNTGYKAYKYRRRLVNGSPDGFVEDNNESGIGDYFPPVVDTVMCPATNFPVSPTPTSTVSITPTPTVSPSSSSIPVGQSCAIYGVDATVEYAYGTLSGETETVKVFGMQGGYFGFGNIYYALYIADVGCRPCLFYGGTATFTNQSNPSQTETLTLSVDNTGYIYFDGYLDDRYLWDSTFTFAKGCTQQDGCLLEGSIVTMANGTTKPIEELKAGDMMMSVDIIGLSPLETRDTWSTTNLEYHPALTVVKRLKKHVASKIKVINNVSSTFEHKHFIRRNGEYFFERVDNIKLNDFFLNQNGMFVEVTEIKELNGVFVTYNLDVEDYDVFYVNGILTHNKNEPASTIISGTLTAELTGSSSQGGTVKLTILFDNPVPENLQFQWGFDVTSTSNIYQSTSNGYPPPKTFPNGNDGCGGTPVGQRLTIPAHATSLIDNSECSEIGKPYGYVSKVVIFDLNPTIYTWELRPTGNTTVDIRY